MEDEAQGNAMSWQERELWAEWQETRTLRITMGETFVLLAWLRLNKFPSGSWYANGKQVAGLLVRAVDAYQEAGMGRKAEAVSRYARLLRREYWRRACK
jgi:hypothetical protein